MLATPPEGDRSRLHEGTLDQNVVLLAGLVPAMHDEIRHTLAATYSVAMAETRAVAEAFVRNERPDLVVIAESGPIDTPAFCTAVSGKPDTADVPIIVLGSRNDPSRHLDALLAGADAYFAEPHDAGLVWARAGRLIAQRYRYRVPLRVVAGFDTPFTRRVRDAIHSRLGDEALSAEDLADDVALSPSQLYRRLHARLGIGPNELIRLTRLKRACELLTMTDDSVSAIARATGFDSTSDFSSLFHSAYGMAPPEYRRHHTA